MAGWTVGTVCMPGPLVADCRCRSLINKTALRHYINNFDFSNLRLDQAFRFVLACVVPGA